MNYFVVLVAVLAVISSAKCGIIERGIETIGTAAQLAKQEAAGAILAGKEILFGKGIRAGPSVLDQGIIPGTAHKIGDGFHLFGSGISHIFAGDVGAYYPLNIMKDNLKDTAKVASSAARDVIPLEADKAKVAGSPAVDVLPSDANTANVAGNPASEIIPPAVDAEKAAGSPAVNVLPSDGIKANVAGSPASDVVHSEADAPNVAGSPASDVIPPAVDAPKVADSPIPV